MRTDERPPWGFWMAGTSVALALLSVCILPFLILAGGERSIAVAIWVIAFFIESGPSILGAIAFAGVIVLFIRLVNRRRGTR